MKYAFSVIFAAIVGATPLVALAQDAGVKTVAAIHKEKTSLAGKEVRLQGKVVKVNNGIMNRNFVHVQDGTGDAGANTLIATSKQTANVGDQVSVTGRVFLNREFGAGYSYPLLLEDSTIEVKR